MRIKKTPVEMTISAYDIIVNVYDNLTERYVTEVVDVLSDSVEICEDPEFIIIKANCERPASLTDILLMYDDAIEAYIYDDREGIITHHVSI